MRARVATTAGAALATALGAVPHASPVPVIMTVTVNFRLS